MQRLEILAIIIALLVVVGTPAATFGYETFLRSQNPDEITIIARAPENGNWSPSTIRVKQGDTVRLRLTSDDVAHGLTIPGLNVKVGEIYPGKFTTVEFVADKPGNFPFFCTVLCSPQHGTMKGEIIVEARAGQQQTEAAPKAKPSAEELASGKQTYQSFCLACHGPDAKGALGPPLMGHSRDQIVTKVRESKGKMPAFSPQQLSDADLDKLVKFLENLGN